MTRAAGRAPAPPTWRMVSIGRPRGVDHALPGDVQEPPDVYAAACGGEPSSTLQTAGGRLVCVGCVRAILGLQAAPRR